jgi:hypothetical protein
LWGRRAKGWLGLRVKSGRIEARLWRRIKPWLRGWRLHHAWHWQVIGWPRCLGGHLRWWCPCRAGRRRRAQRRADNFKREFVVPYFDGLAVVQHKRVLDALAIHIRAIVALKVFDHIPGVAASDYRVAARDAAVILKHNIASAEPSNRKFILVQPKFL